MDAIPRRSLPYYRIAGYSTTIIVHVVNTLAMMSRFTPDAMADANIQKLYSMQVKFITCWTFVAQTIHAVLGLTCDVISLNMADEKEHGFLKLMKYYRDVLFAGIVVPYTFTVPTIFWPLFLYDRELILPAFTSQVVTTLSNHVIHTSIVPLSVWEIAFQPRTRPKSEAFNYIALNVMTAVYLTTLPLTYVELGEYPYPILTGLQGSPALVLFLCFALAWLPLYYQAQWTLTRFFWRGRCR